MKKLLYLCLLSPLFLNAQSYSNRIYETFENQEGANTFSFSKMMIDAIDITTEDDDGTVHHITGDLHKVKFLGYDEKGHIDVNFYERVEKFFDKSSYTKVDFEEETEDVKIYLEKKGKHITEVHMLMKDFNEGSLISFYGKLKAEELCAISEAFKVNACKHLKHIK